MKWIKYLTINKIPYHIYKIKKKDSIILTNVENENNNLLIILCGILYITKVFPNKELLPVAILEKNEIFSQNRKNKDIYYKLTSLETTYVLSIEEHKVKMSNSYISKDINILKSHQKTVYKYELNNEIISQRYTKDRIIQLILIICLQFGKIKNKQLLIPFKLSQKNIAILSGTNKSSVNKTIKKMRTMKILRNVDKKTIYINNLLNLSLK
uniref:Global nitrogen transcriptional regulator n=1 Tax=Polysiphonia sp. TaxID=1967842 RepID=A0A1Z1MUQ8_9FLOR|nr:global nitrogen transcriptional regulator [Polysiphonia sp.]